MMTDETVKEWTIAFNFPIKVVYPSKTKGYQSTLGRNVKTWTDKEEAETFARRVCAKYGWRLVPISDEHMGR